MKIGMLEIGVILLVIFVVALTFRLLRSRKSLTAQGKNNTLEIPEQQAEVAGNGQVKIAGIVLVILGIIALIFGKSTFELVMKMYYWAFIMVAAGLVVLMLSRKR